MDNMKLEFVETNTLKPSPTNPRTITRQGLDKIRRSIERFGFTNPVLAQRATRVVIAGHQRLRAAIDAGIQRVPVIWLDLDDTEAAALNIADNRTAQEAQWDQGLLQQMVQELDQAGFDLSATGLDEHELDMMIGGDESAETTSPDELLEQMIKPRCQSGEVWQLGDHRLACGDSTDPAIWGRIMDGQKADLVVTSPPYNVKIAYRSYQDTQAKTQYLDFIQTIGERICENIEPGRFVAWNVGVSPDSFPHHHVVRLEACGLTFYRQIVWQKQGVPYPIFGSTLRAKRARHYKPNYRHEMIYLLEAAGARDLPQHECPVCDGSGTVQGHVAPVTHDMVVLMTSGAPQLGGDTKPTKRYSGDIWQISQTQATVDLPTLGEKSGGLTKRGKQSHMIKAHPATFPVQLPTAVMTFLTAVGETVVDPFMGAGATLIAAERMGRHAFGIELDPVYCELTMQRWENETGKKAVKAWPINQPDVDEVGSQLS